MPHGTAAAFAGDGRRDLAEPGRRLLQERSADAVVQQIVAVPETVPAVSRNKAEEHSARLDQDMEAKPFFWLGDEDSNLD